ncbi:MAG: LysM peptidoglycan-binding domain-containing protein [Chloroflexi bacterium]|nr:LysM peptidoglycan-binding domain-containing protein [Chloroflexota bacterium]
MSWDVEYFDGQDLLGSPVAERSEASVALTKNDNLPKQVLERGGKKDQIEKFSARFKKQMNGPGKFEFTFECDNGMRAWLGDTQILNKWHSHVGKHIVTVNVPAGSHIVIVEFYNETGAFKAIVNIERVGGQDEEAIKKAWQEVNATGRLTRGGLKAARIYEVDDDGQPVFGSAYPIVYCMFNPASYKVKKSSAVSVKGLDDNKNYTLQENKDKIKPSQLTLNELWFDTSETAGSDGLPHDVSRYTDQLIEFAESTSAKFSENFRDADMAKAPPPKVAFQWGTFRFLGVIESIKIKFTLFSPQGIPTRAKVTLKLKEFRHRKAYPKQNPTSKQTAVERIWRIQAGERLDSIAATIYGDANQWRILAQHNNISDPMSLTPGQMLRVPPM